MMAFPFLKEMFFIGFLGGNGILMKYTAIYLVCLSKNFQVYAIGLTETLLMPWY